MSEYLLSVVIAVYNVKDYLSECINSVINYNSEEVEIILIDDGSQDGSAELCEKYSSENRNVFVYHKNNGGLSDARNYGLKKAKGSYVVFLDGDDYYFNDSIKQICGYIKNTKADMYIGSLYEFYDGTSELKEKEYFHQDLGDKIFEKNEALELILDRCPTYGWYAVKYIIRKDILINNSLYFKNKLKFEDVYWTPRIFSYMDTIRFITKPFYCYRLNRPDSIMNKIDNKTPDQLFILKEHIRWIEMNNISDSLKVKLLQNFSGVYTSILYGQMDKKNKSLRIEIKDMQYMIEYIIRPKEMRIKVLYERGGYNAVYIHFWIKYYVNSIKRMIKKGLNWGRSAVR